MNELQKRAIESISARIKNINDNWGTYSVDHSIRANNQLEVYHYTKECIEKQIPKEYLIIDDSIVCGNCLQPINFDRHNKVVTDRYCQHCGQLIAVSEQEKKKNAIRCLKEEIIGNHDETQDWYEIYSLAIKALEQDIEEI